MKNVVLVIQLFRLRHGCECFLDVGVIVDLYIRQKYIIYHHVQKDSLLQCLGDLVSEDQRDRLKQNQQSNFAANKIEDDDEGDLEGEEEQQRIRCPFDFHIAQQKPQW